MSGGDILPKGYTESKPKDETEICYDCLRTRGFGIALPIIIVSILVITTTLTGLFNWNWLLFYTSWGLIFAVTGVLGYAAYYCLREYCRVNGNDYKDGGAITLFTIISIVTSLIIIAIAIHLPENIEWWVSEHRSWNE